MQLIMMDSMKHFTRLIHVEAEELKASGAFN